MPYRFRPTHSLPILPVLLLAVLLAGPPAAALERLDEEVLSSGPSHGLRAYESATPAVVHDPVHHRLLVVWTAGYPLFGVPREPEIHLRRVEPVDHEVVERGPIQVSALGPPGDERFHAFPGPALALGTPGGPRGYGALVAWAGLAPDGAGEPRAGLFVERIHVDSGGTSGADDLLVSRRAGAATRPAVAHDPARGRWIVAWNHDGGLFLRAVDDATGEPATAEDTAVALGAAHGPPGPPALLYLPAADELLLVVPAGGGATTTVLAQRIDPESLAPLGPPTAVAPPGQAPPSAGGTRRVALAHDPVRDTVLVAWSARSSPEAPESEIWVRVLDGAAGAAPRAPAVRLSAGPLDEPAAAGAIGALDPTAVHDPETDTFAVAWSRDFEPAPADGPAPAGLDREIFGRRADPADGAPAGPEERLTSSGFPDLPTYRSVEPALAAVPPAGQLYLVTPSDYETRSGDPRRELTGVRLLPPGTPRPPNAWDATRWHTGPGLPGFRVMADVYDHAGRRIDTAAEPGCLPETLCLSGALPGRTELLVRVVGPKGNGYLWPTLTKLSTSRFEVWLEQRSTGRIRHYVLPGAEPDSGELPGLFDRHGFRPAPWPPRP